MADYLSTALSHAQKGFYVFPAQQNKRPVEGFMDWETKATNDLDLIRLLWESYPDALPAVAPGKSGHAVIDVDQHEDSANGFATLRAEGITIPDEVDHGISLSGNGVHYWYRADVGSLNGVLPGVDRKSRGGYVIVPYELPLALDIRTALPEALAGGRKYAQSVR